MLERKILDLKNKRKTLLDTAQVHLDGKDIDKYNAAMADVEALNTEIEANERLLNEQRRHPAPPKIDIPQNSGDDAGDVTVSAVDKARSGRDYFNAFVKALSNGANVKKDRGNSEYAPLYNALVGGGAGEDGGYLVPIDIDNRINQFRREFLDLGVHFNNETVTTLSGWRVVDKKPTAGFTLVDEMDEIPRDDQPSFGKIEYLVKKYGMILPVSNELLADNAANLVNYIAWWFARKENITRNTLVLGLLDLLTPESVTPGSEVKTIKTALNVTLDPAISANSKVITNQSGFNALDLLEDINGVPLMQPDITNPTQHRLKGRPVIVVPNAQLPNVSGEAPLYIGDYTQYGTVFTRKPFEMASTNIGGNAWKTDSTEVRGLMRLDARVFDDEAAVALMLEVNA